MSVTHSSASLCQSLVDVALFQCSCPLLPFATLFLFFFNYDHNFYFNQAVHTKLLCLNNHIYNFITSARLIEFLEHRETEVNEVTQKKDWISNSH